MKTSLARICHLVIALLCVVPVAMATAAEAIPFATGEHPPYTSSKLAGQGMATQLVTAVCAAAGLSPTFGFYPWKRAEFVVASGKAFAAFPYARSVEREAQFDFSEPLYLATNALVFNTLNPKTPKAIAYVRDEDLRPYRVGLIRGSFAEARLKEAGVSYELVNDIESGIGMLLASRIDFYMEDRVSIAHIVSEKFPDHASHIQALAKPFNESKANYLMVSRSYPGAAELLEKFNRGLAKLRHSGEYDRLMARYQFSP